MSKIRGDIAEKQALQYLQSQGLRCLLKNYRSRYGEIDLVMLEQPRLQRIMRANSGVIVVVEVRQRLHQAWGGAKASVDYHKQNKLRKTALLLQAEKPDWAKLPWRFDVLTVSGSDNEIEWIKSAFE